MKLPFQISVGINSWLERRNTRARAEKLMSTIAQVNALLNGKSGFVASLARDHIAKAEDRYQQALNGYQADELGKSNRHSDFGLFRLDLALEHLTSHGDKEYDPAFEEGSAELSAATLARALAETKMAIEYGNCAVSERNRKNLVGVVTMFHDCLEMIKGDQNAMSRRTSEGALLMLYLLEREIELDNRQAITQLKWIPKFSAKESAKIKDLVDRIASAKQLFLDTPGTPSTRVTKHIDQATDNFYNAVQAYVDEDMSLVEKLTTTSRMQVEFGERLFKSSMSHEGADADVTIPKDEELANQIHQFQMRIAKIERLIEKRAPQVQKACERLETALSGYTKALEELNQGDLAQADRSARTASAELEAARHLLFSAEFT